ncbi:MAG: hypothetical protein AVDCRST_MAG80-1002 [uncultured Rubrobacteraceae bacterium]|uniref:Uncharacterized protein n=1 Tax=uncultured Rubrobacteraceae bacterium TaxID=349277 RepID=A0A6J4QGR5_9ACTN|nr:MAG: hypothetical protein AVDCRST_MAG80-1002 [uncultured Rubrobacteraceae bacterium]
MPARSAPGDDIAARLFAKRLCEQKVYTYRPSLILGRDVVVARLLPRNEVHRL